MSDNANDDYRYLVDPATLHARLGDPDWVVFDCRFALADPAWGRDQYDRDHIPGARYAHLDEDLSSPIGPDTGRHPLPNPASLCEKLGGWGVGNHTQVVVYDDAGGAFAVRLWWLLRWLGHPKAAVLDGGLGAWLARGGRLTSEIPSITPRTFSGLADRSLWLSTTAIEESLGTGAFQLVDARAAERFRGEIEPIDPVAGHIPGAVNLPCAGNLATDGTFLPPSVLRRRFTAALGDFAPERMVHSCGSGVNACHNLLAMEIAGLHGSRIYAGSWSEWIRSPLRPVATGP
jgi:thiosulfate/3-mercaptopyruvate sulfurtransferase